MSNPINWFPTGTGIPNAMSNANSMVSGGYTALPANLQSIPGRVGFVGSSYQEPAARTRGDDTRHGVRIEDRGDDDQGVRVHLWDQRRRHTRHGRQQVQVSPAPPRHVAELKLVANVRDITGRQSMVSAYCYGELLVCVSVSRFTGRSTISSVPGLCRGQIGCAQIVP
jgi:hypothetical protein